MATITRHMRGWAARVALLAAIFRFWLWTSDSRLALLLLDETGAAGDIQLQYAASSNLSVTSLDSLASSQTWVAGWESPTVDNTLALYTDYRITAKLVVASANNQAGEIRMYLVGMLDDSTWPSPFDGTQSTVTITDTEQRDAICRLAAVTAVDADAGNTYYLECPSVAAVFGGNLPAKFVIFITGNPTTTNTTGLAAAGNNQVTIKGSYAKVAQ